MGSHTTSRLTAPCARPAIRNASELNDVRSSLFRTMAVSGTFGISGAHTVDVAQGLADHLPQRLRHLLHFRELLVRLRKGMRGAGFEPANLYRTATSTLRR